MEYLLIFIFGLIGGSFLNVVIFRLYEGEQFFFGRSKCRSCGQKLTSRDLLPVVSFLLTGGKCRYCQKKISWQYPAVELVTALLFCTNYYFFTSGQFEALELIRNFILISVLVVIFVYDLRWMLISDLVAVPAIIIFIIFSLVLGRTLSDLVLSLVIGFGFFALQYYLSSGKWLGAGDLRLGMMVGAIFTWPGVLAVLFVTYLIGGVVSVSLLLSGKVGRKTAIPLGVFIVPAMLLVLFFGNTLINWYLSLLWF
jgi:leader peptidase (prepilin peptidase) / N-methyltransferase